MNQSLRKTGIALLVVATAGALAALFVRDQVSRYRRDLFSPRSVKRLGALRHMAGAEASVDNITVLRDFIAHEPRGLLRRQARTIIRRMESEILGVAAPRVVEGATGA